MEYHRLYIPFKNLDNVIFCEDIEAVKAKFIKDNNIGVVWFNRNISPKNLNPTPVFTEIKRGGAKIVCDIDDYWNVGFGHVLYDISIRWNLKNSNVSQIKGSDFVTVTHELLRTRVVKELGIAKHKVIIAPNAIDPSEPQYNQSFEYNLENLFWQGSVTHHNDLKQMAGAVNDLERKIYIAGRDPKAYVTDPKTKEKVMVWQATGDLFKKKQWIDYVPTTEYMKFYRNKGVCLIPLERSKFTECKSNLKMLEAGWAMKPVVASGVHPYTTIGRDRRNCLFAYTRQAWREAIKYMLENKSFADDVRYQLNEDVKRDYLINKANEARINLISKIYGNYSNGGLLDSRKR